MWELTSSRFMIALENGVAGCKQSLYNLWSKLAAIPRMSVEYIKPNSVYFEHVYKHSFHIGI